MTRILRYIFFIGTVSTVYYFLHFYVYSSLMRGFNVTNSWRLYLKLIFIFGGISFILSEVLSRRYNIHFLTTFGSIWLGLLAIAITILIFKDLLVLLLPNRRGILNIIALGLIAVTTIISIVNVRLEPRLQEITIFHDKLSGMDEFTLVHLSDTHLNAMSDKVKVQALVERVNALQADVIVITGDVIDDKYDRVKEFPPILKMLSSKWGTYAVTGNHEYYAGIEAFDRFAAESDITVLHNESILIGSSVVLAGVDDHAAKDFSLLGSDLDQALREISKDELVILLAHKPEKFPEAVAKGVDLQLSGHTHAGQIPPMNFLVPLVFKYKSGLYQLESSYIHTSPGTSTWGPPMRLFSRNEITRITLKPVK